MKTSDSMNIHEHKIAARRYMKAIDLRMVDSMPDRNGKPWVVMSDAEARSLALDLLFMTDRRAWVRAVDSEVI